MDNIGKRIYIADDDQDILQIVSLMLEIKQYKVEASTDATTIFNYREHQPDLILLDVWMSGIDGREICQQLKSSPLTKHIPVMFISANSNIKEITEEFCADGYISKPFEMEFFLHKVNEVLSMNGAPLTAQ